MRLSGCPDDQVVYADTQVSISEVTKLIQAELYGLLERRRQIRRRARELSRGWVGLQEGVGRPAVNNVSTESQLPATRRSKRESQASNGAAALDGDSPGPDVLCQQDQASDALRRACRIALLEAGRATCPEEIYSRIARRGSFRFTNHKYAIAAIVRMLKVMGKDGEINSVDGVPALRWELIARQETRGLNS